MKKLKLLAMAVVCLGTVCLQSCGKEEDKKEPITGKTVSINSSDYGKWVYFSFETGDIVGYSVIDSTNAGDVEWQNRTDWDIAFHRQNIKTNSGESGNGGGGILEYPQQEFNFDAVATAPETGYISDTKDSIVYDMTNMMIGIVGYSYCGKSTVTNNWVTLVDVRNSTWLVDDKVFIVKTAQGKFAKIYLKGFKNNLGKSGTVTMQYVYQPDGSRNLQ